MFCLFIFITLLALFAYTAPRTIALEDDGLFVLASYFFGIAHPPGYPLHTLFGKLFTLLPFGSIAYRVHFMSGFFGALACVILYGCALRLTRSRMAALLAAFAYGLSPVFWSQSIIAEVYSLNAFLFFLLLYLIIKIHPSSIGSKSMTDQVRLIHLKWIALVYGLSLTNHWPLIGLSTPGLLIALWPLRKLIARHILALTLIACIGLLPYAWLVIHSQTNPLISFYGPLTNWKEFWFMVARKGYAAADTSQTAGITDKLQYLLFFARETGRQFLIVGTFLMLIGFVAQWRLLPKSLSIGLSVIALFNSIVLILMLNFDYEYLQLYVFKVYPILTYGVMSLWLGLGAHDIAVTLFHKKLKPAWAWLGIMVLTLIPQFYVGFKQLDRHAYNWSKRYALNVLHSLPNNAVLFTKGDVDFGTIAYFHLVQKIRPDVTLMDSSSLVLNNRLFNPITTSTVDANSKIVNFIVLSKQPVYFTRNTPKEFKPYYRWLYLVVSPSFTHINGKLSKSQVQFFKNSIINDQEHDPWTRFMENQLKRTFAATLAISIKQPSDYEQQSIKKLLKLFTTDYYTCIGFAEGIFVNPKPNNIQTVGYYLEAAQKLFPPMAQKSDQAKYYELLGYYNLEVGDKDAGLRDLKKSIAVWPSKENQAVNYLLKLYKESHQKNEYLNLRNRIYKNTGQAQ